MENLEKLLKCFNSPDEDEVELINLIGLKEEEFEQMNLEDRTAALNKRLFDFIDQYGWSDVKQIAKAEYPVSYIVLLLLSEREEDIPEIKDILLNHEKYVVSVMDLKELIERIDDIDFLKEVTLNSSLERTVKDEAISKIFKKDLAAGKEVLKSIEVTCSPDIDSKTFEKMEDEELIKLLLDNRKKFSIDTSKEKILLRKLYEQNPDLTKTYIAEILENPTKNCILKAKVAEYFYGILSNIDEVDNEYASVLATQMIDRLESLEIKATNIALFTDYIKDPEKIKYYLNKRTELDLDPQALKTLLETLSEIDKEEAVNYAKKIINTLDEEQLGLKMTCIIACKDTDFIKECIENRKQYNLEFDQLCTLLSETKDPKYIIGKIENANLQPKTLYGILSRTNNEQLYLYSIKNAEALNLTPEVIYKMMVDRLSIENAVKLLKSAESKGLSNSFKATFLHELIVANNSNIMGFINKYIKNYRANKLDEDSLIAILSDTLKPELIQTYLDAKETPIKESELKLLLYSDRREQILDLIFTGQIPLNEETKKIATFTAYTIKDQTTRKDILKRLKVEEKETKSKIHIPPEMTVGIEIESVGSMSRQIQEIKDLVLSGWEAKKDGSLAGENFEPGVEITSPILHGDDPEINNKIAYISNLLINEGQFVNNSCGGHIHIGADYFKDYESYQNLVDLWVNCEQIFYIISNRAGEVPRLNIAEYAKPISKSFERAIDEGGADFSNIKNLEEIETQLNHASKRCNGINFDNLSDYEKHTIEFRLPNGTINPDTWIENINLFGNTLRRCQEITEIRKKDKEALTPAEKAEVKLFNSLLFDDLSMDDRAKALIDFVVPESQKKIFNNRYFVNSKLLALHNDVKEFLANETFNEPVDMADIKAKLFNQEGRITGIEYAVCSTVLTHEIHKLKGEFNHDNR